VVDGENAAVIEEKLEALTASLMKIGEDIYKAQQEAEATSAGDAEAPSAESEDASDDAEVVDADFEEVTNNDDDSDDKKAS
jgi:molecular chaperone DnaK